jgi:hypothetical protein
MFPDPQTERSKLDRRMEAFARATGAQALFVLWFFSCAAFNFLLGILAEQAPPGAPGLAAAAIGFVAAQAAVHAIWSVMGPWSRWMRLLLSGSTAFVLFASIWTGLAIEEFDDSTFWEAGRVILLSMPLYLLAIQSPLWVVKMSLDCRLVQKEDEDASSLPRRLSLLDLMFGTAAVALALAAARFARPEEVDSADFLIPVLIGAVVVAGVSLFTTVPTLFASHGAPNPTLAVAGLVGVQVFICLGIVGMLSVFTGYMPAEALGLFAVFCASFFAFLNVPMLISRFLGYRLVWGRRNRARSTGARQTSADRPGNETDLPTPLSREPPAC